ncbi:MAG: hypothetical protein ACP5G8_05055 [Athalassotoga sp.]
MGRWKVITIVFILALVFIIFLSSKIVYFSDDSGTGKHSGEKNPQTAVVENVVRQEVPVEFQRMIVTIIKVKNEFNLE